MNILVTGAGGFIGSHVVNHLAGISMFKVTGLYRTPPHHSQDHHVHIADLLDPETFKEQLLTCDVIVHLAGEIDINTSLNEPRARLEHNLSMLLNILEPLRQHEKKPLIVFASTDRVYGATKKATASEKDHPTPLEPYTASKLIGETLLEMYARLYDIPSITLRFDSVYGPRQPRSMFISDVICKMLTHDTITTGNLRIMKNFVYVGDVARAVERAIRAPEKARNTIYNIGGTPATLTHVLRVAQNIIETRRKVTITVIEQADTRPARIEVRPFRLSTARARDFLKWTPRTTLKRGLAETIDYFTQSHHDK